MEHLLHDIENRKKLYLESGKRAQGKNRNVCTFTTNYFTGFTIGYSSNVHMITWFQELDLTSVLVKFSC